MWAVRLKVRSLLFSLQTKWLSGTEVSSRLTHTDITTLNVCENMCEYHVIIKNTNSLTNFPKLPVTFEPYIFFQTRDTKQHIYHLQELIMHQVPPPFLH